MCIKMFVVVVVIFCLFVIVVLVDYDGVLRMFLWNLGFVDIFDVVEYKKDGFYVIGFLNVLILNLWWVVMLYGIEVVVEWNVVKIECFIIIDVNDDFFKQVVDV